MLLEKKIAVVTGAGSTSGIGWATARRMTEEGATVALLDTSEAVHQSASRLEGAVAYICDVRDASRCKAVVEEIVARFGVIDILVNNAGVSQPRTILEIDEPGYDIVFDTSVRGMFNMSRSVIPTMLARKSGSITSIGSVSGERGGGIVGGAHYSAAKGAVHSMSKALARELAPSGIRVNAVAPGLIETELMIRNIAPEKLETVLAATPMGRTGRPEEVANACVFLASELADFVTGITLDVNGGLHIQ